MYNFYHQIPQWIIYTQSLNEVEECILFRLIQKYFLDQKPLPNTEKEMLLMFKRLRISVENYDIAKDILAEFFVEKDGGYVNLIYEKMLNNIEKTAQTAKERGKKGGRPRKNEKTSFTEDINDLRGNDEKSLRQNFFEDEKVKFPEDINKLEDKVKKPLRQIEKQPDQKKFLEDINDLDPQNPERIKNMRKKLNKKLTVEFPEDINDLQNLKKLNNKLINTKIINTTHMPSMSYTNAPATSFSFLKFIEAYPKLVDNSKKMKAATEWRFGKHEMFFAKIMENLNERLEFSKWREWRGTHQEKFIPDPANFLRNKVYEEKVEQIFSEDDEYQKMLLRKFGGKDE